MLLYNDVHHLEEAQQIPGKYGIYLTLNNFGSLAPFNWIPVHKWRSWGRYMDCLCLIVDRVEHSVWKADWFYRIIFNKIWRHRCLSSVRIKFRLNDRPRLSLNIKLWGISVMVNLRPQFWYSWRIRPCVIREALLRSSMESLDRWHDINWQTRVNYKQI